MRPLAMLLLLSLFVHHSASAQLVNGSFEANGTFSLDGWEWTCSDPAPLIGFAPVCEQQAATKGAGNTQGCFPSYLYQRIPNATNGTIMTLSGSVRCTVFDFGTPCLGAFIGFGKVSNGVFTLEENTGTQDTSWLSVSITDTVELGPLDTAIVVLSSGMIGGPADPAPGAFDCLYLEIAQGMNEQAAQDARLIVDANEQVLTLMASDRIDRYVIHDPAGRALIAGQANGRTACIPLNGLAAGVHVITWYGPVGARSQRFVMP